MAETLLQQGQIDGLVSALNGKANWHIGQIVPSTLPITDAGLHLLDGALISGSGTYAAFVDYIADLSAQEIETAFPQPTLTSNGTLGGDSFAVDSDVTQSQYGNVYGLFNSDALFHSEAGYTTGYIEFYNPKPIKITKISMQNQNNSGGSNRASSAGTVYGSDDGSSWTEITTYTNSVQTYNQVWDIDLENNNSYYKYYKIESTAGGSDNYWTIENITLTATYYAPPSYFITEAEWQTAVTTYGVCGKFVYDSVNSTVRLPKITGIIEGTTDTTALGDLVAAGLPNITGSITGSGDRTAFTGASGAFYGNGSTGTGSSSGTVQGYPSVYLDASRSSSIYGNSSTVQPQTIKVLYYICIATSTKTDIQADIDQIATDLNGKADTDFANITSGGKQEIINDITPDYANGISLAQTSNTTWTQVTKDSFVVAWGYDPYTEEYNVYVSPDGGTTSYRVGYRYDDTNANTQTECFSFLVPKGWYFVCAAENGYAADIYPLKGAQ